ncbi:site-specific DNA-methyltransferase [Nibrella viscosa]|uniref:site-specific DNA-methyltransferase (adenine-specific) n=1 Tax=Nibrella viscosa TaxID=1084524 RepID=A0ABP8KCJ6_9BACT
MPELRWLGKDKVVNHHLDVPFRVLDPQYTFGAANDHNRIIHGDNLEALKALLPYYEGRIKCIYIDPPYNTGNENWVYNDNVNDPKIRRWLGKVVGKESEDLTRHDKWLCMMYPRLQLLHRLLAEDGAIFISIDDNEQASLKLMMDEIWGPGNFIANILWKKKTNGNNMGHIPPVHDFIVCYSKDISKVTFLGTPFDDEYLSKAYSNPDNHPKGPWKVTDLSANHKGPYFEITNPVTGEKFLPPKGRYWVFNEAEVNKRIHEGRIIFGKNGTSRPVQRVFLHEKGTPTRKAETWWDKHGLNADGMQELSGIFGAKIFDHPKPTGTLKHLFSISTGPNDIILDSFAGSGTTAHAVLNLNKQDGGNRQFILVEMEDYAESITAERVRRVIDGYGGKEGTGGGFTYYELGPALFTEEGLLNEALPVERIREYVWYSETRAPFGPQIPHPPAPMDSDGGDNPYLLGVQEGTAYYFYYEPEELTTLDYEFLATVRTSAEQYVIYADNCLLPREWLQQRQIIFKKIPRDISRF